MQIRHALKQRISWDEEYRLHVELAALRMGLSVAEAAAMRREIDSAKPDKR